MVSGGGSRQLIRIAIADDQELVRTGLRMILEGEADFQVVGEAADGEAAIELTARERPDVPVLGLTSNLATARRLAVVWGVHAVQTTELHTMSESVTRAARIARSEGFAIPGQEIVVTAGIPFNQPGTTNALRVAMVK